MRNIRCWHRHQQYHFIVESEFEMPFAAALD